ncbi:MAG TPA: twin-arginine translocase TatA/TatE family subunit [Bryobacteraceae bacterium]|nr:twin-arginine translocase TatA/TatE family subunit [Bryobacteraceae bacterium]
MGPVGVQEMIVIFLVALVLFGPKKLPELGRTIGKAITEFRRAQSELKATFEGHMRELEKENESLKEVTRSYTNEIYNHYTEYDSSYYDSGAVNPGSNQSTAANPSTVSAPATQGAESPVSPEAPANGTVPRTATAATSFSDQLSETASTPAESPASAPESHSVNS